MGETTEPARAVVWDPNAARRQLVDDGYCHVPGILDAAALQATRAAAVAALAAVGPDHRARWRSEGSLVPLSDHPPFAALIARPAIRDMLERMDLGEARFSSGYVISKSPGVRTGVAPLALASVDWLNSKSMFAVPSVLARTHPRYMKSVSFRFSCTT